MESLEDGGTAGERMGLTATQVGFFFPVSTTGSLYDAGELIKVKALYVVLKGAFPILCIPDLTHLEASWQ